MSSYSSFRTCTSSLGLDLATAPNAQTCKAFVAYANKVWLHALAYRRQGSLEAEATTICLISRRWYNHTTGSTP